MVVVDAQALAVAERLVYAEYPIESIAYFRDVPLDMFLRFPDEVP
jgi:hypothetical protein